jgi:anti-sigma regulatory factor (Ser/Thr protein kinase)
MPSACPEISRGQAAMTTERHELVIENRLGELPRVERWLARLCAAWGLSAKTTFVVDLLVNEAVTNVITHGYDDAAEHRLVLALSDVGDSLVIEVVDDGVAFNPLEAPAMVVGSDLEHATVGGRGIHLIKTYSREQHYDCISGANRLRLSVDKES